jgi:flagellar hook-basal body complex protein FliE
MVSGIGAVASPALAAASAGQTAASMAAGSGTSQTGFAAALNQALDNVSTAQNQASAAEAGFAAGVPGDTLAKALVASDRAEVAWNATVAVRNELVSAYQSVMNMQF